MKFEQVCQSLNSYFGEQAYGRILLPISVPAMLACVLVRLVGYFLNLGSFIPVLVQLAFFLFLLMVLSACNFRMAAAGLGVYAVYFLCAFLKNLIKYHSLSWGSLLNLAVFGFLAFMAYRKSVSFN